MNRSIKYERLFPMGQYSNVRFVDEIVELPESVCMNEELMAKIRYLQMVDAELAYRKYLQLFERAKTLDLEELAKSLEFLESERNEILVQIQEQLK